MKDSKIDRLLGSAAKDNSPPVPEDFATRVMRQVHRPDKVESVSILDQINTWYPRLALGAGLAIAICLLAELGLSALEPDSLSENVAQASLPWVLP